MIENNFFKQFKHLEPFFEVQKRMQPFLDAQEKILPLFEMQKKIQPMLDFQKKMQPIIDIQKRMQPFIEMHMEAQKKLNAFFDAYLRLADGIEVLPKDGWYLGFEFIYEYLGVDYLNEIVCNWNIDETKNNFRNKVELIFEKRIDEIQESLVTSFAKRRKIIEVIFQLHKDGNYIASIPVALAQLDGICKEIFIDDKNKKIGFFDKNKKDFKHKLPQLKKVANNNFLLFLYNQLSLNNLDEFIVLKYGNSEMEKLNRHTILHGESVEYGTKENSLKAILLLYFIRDFIELVSENKENTIK